MDMFKNTFINRPHVVILGAGATRASFPNGDKNCKVSPLMNDMVKVLNLDPLLSKIGLKTESSNIEDIYSELIDRGEECTEIRIELEEKIKDYFISMEIPDHITNYDLLLISLTKKDCVASFNWDPLIIQAYNRVSRITDNLPEIIFLHGNVFAGVCGKCKKFGPIINSCPKCNKNFISVPLLYPVKHKDYNQSIFIRHSWNKFKDFLSRAAIVTIYGYGAPASDIEASKILTESFSKYEVSHKLDLIEIIEKKEFNRSDLSNTWNNFISTTNGTYNLYGDFFDSLLAKAPRRSVEYYFKQYIEGWWGLPTISLSKEISFEMLNQQIHPLLVKEKQNDFSVI